MYQTKVGFQLFPHSHVKMNWFILYFEHYNAKDLFSIAEKDLNIHTNTFMNMYTEWQHWMWKLNQLAEFNEESQKVFFIALTGGNYRFASNELNISCVCVCVHFLLLVFTLFTYLMQWNLVLAKTNSKKR